MTFRNEVLAVLTRGLLRAIDGRGPDRTTLLHSAGLSEADVADPDVWIPVSSHVRLGRAISAALPRQNLGLQTGAPIYSDPRGALGYCLRHSRVHSRALKNFCSYIEITNRSLNVTVSVEPEETSITLRMVPDLEAAGHPAEALFAAWLSLSRYLTNTNWSPLRVEFVHQPLGDTEEHRALFGCDVGFGCPQTRLWLPASAYSLPIHPASHEYERELVLAHEHALTLVGQDPTATACLHELSQALRSVPLDVRGLDSRSAKALTARLALARGLLERSASFVHEVAYLTGFDDLRRFSGAFMEHFGVCPAELRLAR